MQSLCELPLVAGPRILGSLFFMSSAKAAYGHLQQSFLEQVASAVAVALDDCLAHEEVRRLGNELSARTIAQLERQQRHMSDALQEASKALDASEERFRDLFDEAPIAYVHEGLDSRFIRANRAAMKNTRHSARRRSDNLRKDVCAQHARCAAPDARGV